MGNKRNKINECHAVLILPGIELRFYSMTAVADISKRSSYAGVDHKMIDNLYGIIARNDNFAATFAGTNLPVVCGDPPQLIANGLSLIILIDMAKEGRLINIPTVYISSKSSDDLNEIIEFAGMLERRLSQGLAQIRTISKNTKIRNKRIMAGQWCPICGPGKGELKVKAGKNQIYCTRKKCGFHLDMTSDCLAKFKKGNLTAFDLKAIMD